MRVQNLISSRGTTVANQFQIDHKNKTYFQSYESLICVIDRNTDKVKLSTLYDYSRTTMRYLLSFLRSNGYREITDRKALEQAIKEKRFKVVEKDKLGKF